MRTTRALGSIALAGGLALGLTGCGMQKGGPAIGSEAVAFEATTAGGESFSLRDKRGSVVVLDFYANW